MNLANGKLQYLVKFKRLPEAEWVVQAHLRCPEKLRQFNSLRGEDLWEVELILKKRKSKTSGQDEFRIKWLSWTAKFNSWEPIDNVPQAVVEDFESRLTKLRR